MKIRFLLAAVTALSFRSVSAKELTMLSCSIDTEIVSDAGGKTKTIKLSEPFIAQFAKLDTESPKYKSDGTFGLMKGEFELHKISGDLESPEYSVWYSVKFASVSASIIELVKERDSKRAYLHRLFSRMTRPDFPDRVVFGNCR